MKKILMIGTGGTIASEMTPEGLTPELNTHQLLAYLPRIAQLCHVDCIQLYSLDSTSIHPTHWLGTAQATAPCMIINKRDAGDLQTLAEKIISEFGLPVVIKAATQGSSIGVVIPKTAQEVVPALEEAFKYSENVLAEKCIKGKELTISIMEENGEPKPLPVIWIAPHSGAYDFHSKYTKGATDYHCPAPFDEKTTAYIQKIAVETYKLLGLSGVARVDAMLGDEDGVAYVLEANTVPGMTATSLVPKAAAAVGISFPELCEKILLSAK